MPKGIWELTTPTFRNQLRSFFGLRINRAGDDAAGLAISEKMRSQSWSQDGFQNSQDAISLIQTAEGALTKPINPSRMRELAVQAATDTNESVTVSLRMK